MRSSYAFWHARRGRRKSVLVLIVRASGGVIAEKLAVRIVVPMNREASFPTHPHTPKRRRHAFARRHDDRVSLLVREVVVLLEHGKLNGAKVLRDLGEREPADLDEAEERLGREQAVVLVRVAHVPVRTAMSDGTSRTPRAPRTRWAPPTRAQSRGR